MRTSSSLSGVAAIVLLGVGAAQGAVIVSSTTAPLTAAISQPDASAAAFNGSQDFSDNGGPPGQTFTAPSNLTLTSIAVKGFANTGASFGGFDATTTMTITVSRVDAGGVLTRLDQEVALAPSTLVNDGSAYLTFALTTPVALTAGTQYAYDIFSSNGYFGFAKSSTDVYAGGAAIQHGTAGRTSADAATITNAQTVDRTFFINPVPAPEPASLSLLAAGSLGLLARRRRA